MKLFFLHIISNEATGMKLYNKSFETETDSHELVKFLINLISWVFNEIASGLCSLRVHSQMIHG